MPGAGRHAAGQGGVGTAHLAGRHGLARWPGDFQRRWRSTMWWCRAAPAAGMVELRGRSRRPLHVQPALGRLDRCHPDRFHRLFAVGRRPVAAPDAGRHRAGADRAACVVESADRLAGFERNRDRSRERPRHAASISTCSRWPAWRTTIASCIRRSPHTITFLHPQGWSYYATLREKLHWHEYP